MVRETAGSTEPRPGGASARFGSVPFALKRHRSAHGQVTAVSMMKDEGPYVIEWVAHHLAIGFTDLLVYTNDCTDGTDAMLIRLEELGLVHHRRNLIAEGMRPQPSALNHAEAEPVVQQSDWVMVFDADEFLSIRYGDGSLEGLLDHAVAAGANGIVITWRIFGSGGITAWSPAPVTEQYLRAAPPDWNKGWGVKTLFRYDPLYWKLGIHRPKLKSKWLKTDIPDQIRWLNGSGREMEDYFKFRGWRSISRTVGYDQVQLNHYAVKSAEAYALRKLRGNVNNKKDKYNADYWSLQDRNEVADEVMLRYSARRNAVIDALLSDPVLRRLHEAAIAGIEERLALLRQTPDYTALLAELKKAATVPLSEVVAKPPRPRDREKIAALMSEVEKSRNLDAKRRRKSEASALPLAATYQPDPGLEGFHGDWADNQGVLLPPAPGLFGPAQCDLVAKGKFERGIARRLPQLLDQSATLLVLGSGCGFLIARLAKARPDLRLTAQENHPGLRAVMQQILGVNGLTPSGQMQLSDETIDPAGLAALLAQARPDALILAEPALSAGDLAFALRTHRPAQIAVAPRALSEGKSAAADWRSMFSLEGYLELPGFDPASTLFFIAKTTAPRQSQG